MANDLTCKQPTVVPASPPPVLPPPPNAADKTVVNNGIVPATPEKSALAKSGEFVASVFTSSVRNMVTPPTAEPDKDGKFSTEKAFLNMGKGIMDPVVGTVKTPYESIKTVKDGTKELLFNEDNLSRGMGLAKAAIGTCQIVSTCVSATVKTTIAPVSVASGVLKSARAVGNTIFEKDPDRREAAFYGITGSLMSCLPIGFSH